MSNPTAANAARLSEAIRHRRRIPCATYRLQFSAAFTFRDALDLVPYLDRLGITDVYVSPILQAVPGSTHGYDVCDPTRINVELGGEDDFLRLAAALRERGMGLLLDIVPNHMGIAGDCNRWWLDVLEYGPASPFASFFDIDWNPVKPELADRVLLPILEDQYGSVLDSGKLRLTLADGALWIEYVGTRLPIAPRSYPLVLRPALAALAHRPDAAPESVAELQAILAAFESFAAPAAADSASQTDRRLSITGLKRLLAILYDADAEVRAALDETIAAFNGIPGDPRSFDSLDRLLNAQFYRLAFWRVAGDEINYRRFFDVNTMAALRAERPDVLAATHQVIFRLLRRGDVTGLRVDHPDGLWDPAAYFRQLQRHYLACLLATDGSPFDIGEQHRAEIDGLLDDLAAESGFQPWPLYVVAEKILTEREPLPLDWAVYGTTGYDFMAQVNGLFVDSAAESAFDDIYAAFTGETASFPDIEYAAKHKIMRETLASEVNALAHRLERLAERNRHYRDFTLNGLRFALREIIASLDVYRTYVTGPDRVPLRDQQVVEAAVRDAIRRNPRASRAIFIFIRDTLLLRNIYEFPESDRGALVEFAMKFQQITGPVMAKSVEDTAFYAYNRLVSLNEVGGNPALFGLSPADFHQQIVRRQAEWPHTMLALSTHDTKRGEDVRARLNVLSEMPAEWDAALRRWRELNEPWRTSTDDGPAPSADDEYLLYQTLIGAWPFDLTDRAAASEWDAFRERVRAYMIKAAREAKLITSWTNPDEVYEQALADFVDRLFDRAANRAFLDDFAAFQRRVAFFGVFNSLSQTLLKLTCPGVPDTYRGAETWDFNLVDPDNRRPVDYARLQSMLDSVQSPDLTTCGDRAAFARQLVKSAADGRVKLYLVASVLAFRRHNQALFNHGDYIPLSPSGDRAAHVVAFARRHGHQAVIAIAPRLVCGLAAGEAVAPLGEIWADTALDLPDALPHRHWRDLFTGAAISLDSGGKRQIPLAATLTDFPVALLIAES